MLIETSNTPINSRSLLQKYLFAFVLGDGSLTKRNLGGNAQFVCNQIADNEDYIMWRADILSNIAPVIVSMLASTSFVSPNGKTYTRKQQLHTITRVHPIFTAMYNRMYPLGYKTLNDHDIKSFDWESLAIWYMDDGGLVPHGNSKYVRINSQSFSFSEHIVLKKLLKDKFDLEFNIGKSNKGGKLYYHLGLRAKDTLRMIDGIHPFIKQSFMYKLEI